jgi:hypothetical protein
MCFGTLGGLTFLVLHPKQRDLVVCDIVSQENGEFDCSWMYGRGPEWCRAEKSRGLKIMIRYKEVIIPLCAMSCNCCDQNGCHDFSPATDDCLLLPEKTLITNETLCFVDKTKQRAFLAPLAMDIGSYIALGFWWLFGCGCFCGFLCIWMDENKHDLPCHVDCC